MKDCKVRNIHADVQIVYAIKSYKNCLGRFDMKWIIVGDDAILLFLLSSLCEIGAILFE